MCDEWSRLAPHRGWGESHSLRARRGGDECERKKSRKKFEEQRFFIFVSFARRRNKPIPFGGC